MMTGKRFLFVVFVAGWLGACAPRPQQISHKVVVPISGPSKDDVDLHIDGQQEVQQLNWSEEEGPATIFRTVENLFMLQGVLAPEARTSWAAGILASVPQTSTKLVDSPYTALMTSQAQQMAEETLARVVPELKATPKKALKIVKSVKFPFGAKENITLTEAVHRLFRYLRAVDSAIASSSLMKEVIDGIHQEIAKMLDMETRANSAVRAIESSRTLAQALWNVDSVVHQFGFQVTSVVQAQIQRARGLATQIDAIRDSRSALTTLVSLWIYMTPEQRVAYFRPASTDLYDYLNGKTMDELHCLQSPDCLDPAQWIARTLVIQPKIEQYGVDRIRVMLNSKAADEVRSRVLATVLDEIKQVPETMSDRLKTGIQTQIEPVLRLKGHFAAEMRARLDTWSQEHFEVSKPAVLNVQMARATMEIVPGGRVRLRWLHRTDDSLEAKAAFDVLAPTLWETSRVDSHAARGLALAEIGALTKEYQSKTTSVEDAVNLPAVGFAESVRGYANLAMAFREWQPSAFDLLLGQVTAHDLFPEFNTSALVKSIFPKGAFYALSFHGLSEILSSATGPRTPVFLVDSNNHVTRANREISESDVPAVMAGIADRVGQDLGPRVRAEDVARYLIAMCEVFAATDGVERATSEILTQPDKDGKIARDEIIQGRARIKLLVLGLANYLSHQFRSGGELVRHELDLATQKPITGPVTVLDQALAIRALVSASDIVGKDIYYWEAVDLVYSMNRRMFRRDLGFYGRDDETAVSPVALVEMLRALEKAAPHLPDGSRHQIENLMAPWRRQLSQWHLEI